MTIRVMLQLTNAFTIYLLDNGS